MKIKIKDEMDKIIFKVNDAEAKMIMKALENYHPNADDLNHIIFDYYENDNNGFLKTKIKMLSKMKKKLDYPVW